MTILSKIKSSIYSPSFYAEVQKKSLGSAFGYFFLLILLVSLIGTFPVIFSFVTKGQNELKSIISDVKNKYPQELEVKIKDGVASTNVVEPYVIPMTSDMKNETTGLQNLLVIDTKTPFSITQYKKYNAAVWLTKDGVYYRSNNTEEVRSQPLEKFGNVTINKKYVDEMVGKISPWIKYLAPILLIVIIIGLFLFHMLRLAYLFFFALCALLLAKAMKKSLSYGTAYKVGLYAITLGFIVELFQWFLGMTNIPFLFTVVSLIVVYINLKNQPATKSSKKK